MMKKKKTVTQNRYATFRVVLTYAAPNTTTERDERAYIVREVVPVLRVYGRGAVMVVSVKEEIKS